jgi:hypothetical protein
MNNIGVTMLAQRNEPDRPQREETQEEMDNRKAILEEARRRAREIADQPPAVGPPSPSSKVNPVADVNGFSVVENRDLLGNDLRQIERVDLKVCAATCESEPLCKAYSYDKWNRWCFLKRGAAPLSLDPSSITGVRSELGNPVISDAPIRLDTRTNKKLLTSSYRTTSVSSVEDCQSECAKEDRCLGTTFIRSQRSCQLFEAIATIAPDKGAVSAVKTQNPR